MNTALQHTQRFFTPEKEMMIFRNKLIGIQKILLDSLSDS